MNTQYHKDSDMDAFGQAIAQRLEEGTQNLPHEISERLRVGRALALSKRRKFAPSMEVASAAPGAGATLQWGSDEDGLLGRLGSWLPLLLLVIGLVSIGVLQDDMRADELAEIDAEILTDVLPPSAYADPGFAMYLRSNQPD